MKGSTTQGASAASISAIDRVVAYRRLAPGYQWRRLWAGTFWSVSVVLLAGEALPSLHPSLAALSLVPLAHSAVRLRRPGLTATDSVVLDFLAALGFLLLASPPAAVQMSLVAYLLAPMLLFLSIAQAGRLVAGFVAVAVASGFTEAPWTAAWSTTETVRLTAVTALAAAPMAVWGYRRVAGHLLDNARLHADLARREKEFQDLWEGAAVALYRVDPEGRFLRVNRRMAELIGATEETGSPRISDLWEDRDAYRTWLHLLDAEGEVRDLEWDMRRVDGDLIAVRETARVVTDEAGEPQYVEGSVEDITDRVETTRQLRFHASVLDHVRSAVVATDTRGVVTYWNRHAERLHGWSAEETVGRPIFEFVVPASAQTMEHILAGLREQGYWEGEADMRRSDGKLVPTRTVTGTLRDAEGRPVGSVGVSADISDLKQANRRLRRLLESKDQFISAVSHELRTPLAGLVGFVELLRSCRAGQEEWPEYLEMVTSQAHELSRIVEDLLVAGRLDHDDLTILPRRIRLCDVVDDLFDGWEDAACVERGDLDLAVVADPLRLSQILRNLVSNAIQYGSAPRRITAEPDGEQVVIRVVDHGPGISDDLRDDVFHPYQRARIDRARPGHLGLGLHVARSLAELMHGGLEYHNAKGMSCFSLRLPTRTQEAPVETMHGQGRLPAPSPLP